MPGRAAAPCRAGLAAREAVALGWWHSGRGRDLDAAIEAEVAPYLCRLAAVAAAKALARALGPRIDAAVIDDSIARLADAWEGDAARQGIAAFFAKVPPPWVASSD
jgi:methylglutaconyl-CoA hydratase